MYDLDISPGDTLKLLDYDEIEWFISEVSKCKKRKDILYKSTITEAIANGRMAGQSKKSNLTYNRLLKKYNEEYRNTFKEETFWEAMRKDTKKKTFFDIPKEERI